ncbi:MAG: LptE family protein, partial [Phycisphaeraceae bacterium]|nr:LptE family protein [Phycisphaeraceae bacterium]
MRNFSWNILTLMLVTLVLSGCGYTQLDLFSKEYQSVAVPIFQNKTFYRGVEFDLTEALIKEIELRSPYKVTLSGSAQTILEGQIVSISQNRLSRTQEGGLVQEIELQMVVNFLWKQQVDGKVLRRRDGIIAIGRYVAATPISEPFETGQHVAVQEMAKRIV